MTTTTRLGQWACALILAALPSHPAGAALADDLCGTTIVEDLRLDQDLTCAGNGLTVGADGIRMNLNGHVIAGAGTGVGILVMGRTDVSISGGVLRNFASGIRINASRDVVVKDMELRDNNDGIDCQAGCSGNTVKANAFVNNGARGIMIRGNTVGNIVKANTFTGNRVGILLFGSVNAIVKDNIVSTSVLAGIRVNPIATGNLVLANTITSNPSGIDFIVAAGLAASGNAFLDNTIALNGCGLNGPYAGNIFSGNVFQANSADTCGI